MIKDVLIGDYWLNIHKFIGNQSVMGEFVTLRNEESLLVSFVYSSLAKRYRHGKFYLANKDNISEVFQLINIGPQKALVSKTDLFENSLLLIRLQCIVTKGLLSQKKIIMETTHVHQKVEDERKDQEYFSDHTKDPTEYSDKTTYTFVISKYIEIKFDH